MSQKLSLVVGSKTQGGLSTNDTVTHQDSGATSLATNNGTDLLVSQDTKAAKTGKVSQNRHDGKENGEERVRVDGVRGRGNSMLLACEQGDSADGGKEESGVTSFVFMLKSLGSATQVRKHCKTQNTVLYCNVSC